MSLQLGVALLVFCIGAIGLLWIRLALHSRARALQTEAATRQERGLQERMERLQRTQSPGAPPPPSFGETRSKRAPR